jgi:hypothetical protein
MDARFYVAFAGRVVATDDLHAAVTDKRVTAFMVVTRRMGHQFMSAVEDGVDVRFAATRWVGTYLPNGAFQVRYWNDSRSRAEGEPADILTLAAGVWRSVHGNYDILPEEDVKAPEPSVAEAE